MTGTASSTMPIGLLTWWSWSSRRLNAEMTLRRLIALALRCPLAVAMTSLRILLLLEQVEATDEALDRLGAHPALEVVAEAVAQLAPDPLVVDQLLAASAARMPS